MVDKDSPLFTLCVILTFWMVTAGAVLVEFVAGASTVGAVVLSFLAGIVGAGDGVPTEVASPESAAFSELVSRLIVLAEVSDEATASEEFGTEESKLLVLGHKVQAAFDLPSDPVSRFYWIVESRTFELISP
jgi:hypothetical protein